VRQLAYALRPRDLVHAAKFRIGRLERDEQRIAELMGREVRDLDVLIVGPGQLLKEARYFGRANRVTTLDLDEIPQGLDFGTYARMIQKNGFGRFAKTVGRKVLGVDRAQEAAWREALEVPSLPEPRMIVGDVCDLPAEVGQVDAIASWSVFQCIPDPEPAFRNMVNALRPGGVLYIGIHLYTANTGMIGISGCVSMRRPMYGRYVKPLRGPEGTPR
jgi:SAM-dependent methyltransferase